MSDNAFCLCGHSYEAHGLDYEEVAYPLIGKRRAPCQQCDCTVWEEDPTFEEQSRVDAASDWAADDELDCA